MKLNVIILIVLLFTIMSCKKEEPTIQQKEPQVEHPERLLRVYSELPKTMAYGDTIIFKMNFGYSPCFESVYLIDNFQDKIITMKVFARYPIGNYACVDAIYHYAINYSFTPKSRGTYIFKFGQTENSFLMDTLIVQ